VTAILPGSTIGIMGGGQLGRMMTLAARTMGYHVHILDPDPECAAAPVADEIITAAFDDAQAAAELARSCDVVTVEIEKIAIPAMRAAAAYAPVRPGAHVLHVVQDRGRQKRWLSEHGFPVGEFWTADTLEQLRHAAAANDGAELFVKSCAGGYDGRGQVRLAPDGSPEDAWRLLGANPVIAERALELQAEISVLVARTPTGTVALHPPALNHHVNGVLDWSVIPAIVHLATAAEAEGLGRRIAEALDVVGLLAVEMFVLRGGRLVVNELAPRPHNTFHHTELSCLTSQFEQGIRAVCDLPLGATDVLRPAAIANLFGDLWLGDDVPPFDTALKIPGVRVHLYGKQPRAGRKVGHIGAVGVTEQEAVAKVQEARALLSKREHRTAPLRPPG
jgi:5-(carboxyamino)imidazole ribonucleotide synthase